MLEFKILDRLNKSLLSPIYPWLLNHLVINLERSTVLSLALALEKSSDEHPPPPSPWYAYHFTFYTFFFKKQKNLNC